MMQSSKDNVEQKLLPYGDEPFIYAGNLNLYDLAAWLENKAKEVRTRQQALCKIKYQTQELIERLNQFIKHHDFSNALRLNQESNLLQDSNQCTQQIQATLSYLNTSELLPGDFLGSGLPEEQKQALREKENQDD